MNAEKILKDMGIELKPINRKGKSVVPIRSTRTYCLYPDMAL